MNIFKVKTASGSTYTVDTINGFWSHNDESPERLWIFLTGNPGDSLPINPYDITINGGWNETPAPIVGERMYLTGRDRWRVSSLVVSYEAAFEERENSEYSS